MRLEEEIKQQKKFTNDFEKLVVNIMYTSSWIESLTIQRMKPFGISPQQYNVLRILRGAYPNPIMLSEIAKRMIDKNSNATRLVEKLRVKGMVKREICEKNRRQVDITITKTGMDLLAELDKTAEPWFESLNTLNTQEIEHLNNVLDKLRG